MFKTVITAASAFALATTLATAAAGQERIWQIGNDSMHVYFDDLDMNSAAGRAGALSRIERAAERLCRDTADRHACASEAVRGAIAAAGAPALRMAMAERDGVRVALR